MAFRFSLLMQESSELAGTRITRFLSVIDRIDIDSIVRLDHPVHLHRVRQYNHVRLLNSWLAVTYILT